MADPSVPPTPDILAQTEAALEAERGARQRAEEDVQIVIDDLTRAHAATRQALADAEYLLRYWAEGNGGEDGDDFNEATEGALHAFLDERDAYHRYERENEAPTVYSDSWNCAKPEPQGLREVLERVGIHPKRGAVNDPLAAHRAVPMGYNGDDDEWAEGPDE